MTFRDRAMIGLLAAVASAMAAYPAGDPDVFFHLAAGRDIVASGRLPDTETSCLVSEGRPFLNHEWGFDALLWLAHEAMGPAGVTVFKAGIAAVLFALVGLVGVRLGAPAWLVVVLGVAWLPLFRVHLEARPHLAGYALAAGAILALLRLREGRSAHPGSLAAIMVAWTNVHGSFPLGWVLWGVVFASSLAGPRPSSLRPLLVAGPVAALATLVNPWGLDLWAVVAHHAEPAYRDLVPEWKPVALGENPVADVLFLLLVAGASLSFLPKSCRVRLDRLGLLLVFLVPAALSSKFTLGLAVGAVPVLAANLAALRVTTWPGSAPLVGCVAAASVLLLPPRLPPWIGPGVGLDVRDHPDAALRVARRHGIEGRVFAPFHEGGFVEYKSHGTLRPFIDGRAYVHGLHGIRRYLHALADFRAFQDLHAAFRFDFVIADLLDPSFPRLLSGLAEDSGFALVHLDDRYAAFAPATGAPAKVEPYRILRPTTDPRYLADLPDVMMPAAHVEVARVLAAPEGETLGRLLRGVLYLREAKVTLAPDSVASSDEGRTSCTKAIEDFAALVRRRPDVPMFRYFHAKVLACAGRCEEARLEAARAAPRFSDASRLLEALDRCHGVHGQFLR